MKPKPRLPGTTYAISNTGPLISAFQSNSFGLLTQIFVLTLRREHRVTYYCWMNWQHDQ